MSAPWAAWPRSTRGIAAVEACLGRHIPLRLLAPGYIDHDPGARQPLSFAVNEPGQLEALIRARIGQAAAAETGRIMRDLVALRITHHSAAPLARPPELPAVKSARRVLAVAGTGGRSALSDRMLDAALAENPGAEIWLYAPGARLLPPVRTGIHLITTPCNSYVLLEQFDAVCTVDSIIGFEALLAGLPVRVFGSPFYAGRGLTQDTPAVPRGGGNGSPASVSKDGRTGATLAELFEAAYLQHGLYLKPDTHGKGTITDAMDMILLQRSVRQRYAGLGPLAAQGFSRWKRPFARPFLEATGERPSWQAGGAERPALWGAAQAPVHKLPPVRMEDGFLRSVGLGSDLAAPHSMVLDTQGIYFDPGQPGELEGLLNTPATDEALLARAEKLRDLICRLRLSKYNLGHREPGWAAPAGRCVVLVPGQVSDDASVVLGARGINTMEALLTRVRELRPDAFLVYKPHPDVLSGNRKGLVQAQALCDVVDDRSDLISLIERADEVHTLTSLAGFEALLRHKRVYTYGHPFYVGWGLTHDCVNNIASRRSVLTLQQMIAAVLILYPLYWDWKLGLFTTPEAAAHALGREMAREQEKLLPHTPPVVRLFAKARRWLRNALLA